MVLLEVRSIGTSKWTVGRGKVANFVLLSPCCPHKLAPVDLVTSVRRRDLQRVGGVLGQERGSSHGRQLAESIQTGNRRHTRTQVASRWWTGARTSVRSSINANPARDATRSVTERSRGGPKRMAKGIDHRRTRTCNLLVTSAIEAKRATIAPGSHIGCCKNKVVYILMQS